MATEKRRGRPPGSKNKPKVVDAALLQTGVMPSPSGGTDVSGPGITPTRFTEAKIRELRTTQTHSAPADQGSHDDDPRIFEPLALLTRQRFQQARLYRSSEALDKSSTEQVLRECYQQISGRIDPNLLEAIQLSGVDLTLNLTELKVDAFEAWSRSILTDSEKLPFTVNASPIPELNELAKEEVLQQLKMELFASNAQLPDDMLGFVRQMKERQLELMRTRAQGCAENMMRLMEDQCLDGAFRPALLGVIRDMASYPYCVMEGPVPTVRDVLKWSGTKLVKSQKIVSMFHRRSPFDLFWTADSTTTQNGTAVFLRERMTQANLIAAARLKTYIARNVINAIDRYAGSAVNRDWTSWNPERSKNFIGHPWGNDQSIDVVTMYSKLSGDELRPYGYSLDSHLFFETKVKTIGPYAIQVLINRSPSPFSRPIYTASLTQVGERIAGRGLAQKLRDIERGYHAALRGLIRNVHFSSGPIGEVDYSRIARWIEDDDIGMVEPYTVYPTDPDITGGGRPAHFFHTVPNVAQALIGVMDFFSRQADRFSQIPSAFHGEAVGTGVNRTFRGVTLLQGNALKGLQAALTNLGTGIITPCVQNLYNQNMMYSKDESVKGDTQPKVSDIAGLLDKEVAKQEAIERMQLVAQVAQAGAVSPAAVAWTLDEVLKAAGVPLGKTSAGAGGALGPGGMAAPAGPPQAQQGALPGPGSVVPPDQGISAPNISPT